MSLDHLKKQAINAKKLLTELFEQHSPPYTLAECQEFAAHLNGFPSWHIAQEALQSKPVLGDDPIAAFYNYDWRKASPEPFVGLNDPEKCMVTCHSLAPEDAMEFILSRSESGMDPSDSMVVVNAAGEAGGLIIDQILENRELVKRVGGMSLTTFSHRVGATFNPFAGLTASQAASLLLAIISPVASSKQANCCSEALDLVLSGIPQEELDLPTIQQAMNNLICLADGGWSKNNEDFYETFPDEDRHDEAHAFLASYPEEIASLLRPLDALLTRLTAPGMGRTFSPRLCKLAGEGRDEFLWVKDGMVFALIGIEIVNLSFGSELIDHLAALLVVAKVLYASRFNYGFDFKGTPPIVDVVWIRPPML